MGTTMLVSSAATKSAALPVRRSRSASLASTAPLDSQPASFEAQTSPSNNTSIEAAIVSGNSPTGGGNVAPSSNDVIVTCANAGANLAIESDTEVTLEDCAPKLKRNGSS